MPDVSGVVAHLVPDRGPAHGLAAAGGSALMGRARNIKPGFFKNEDLAECSFAARLCFAGLWTLADREGRLEDRPKRVKAELFAFDTVDVEPLLAELADHGFILRYEVEGHRYIQVIKFAAHQSPHYSEKASVIKASPLREMHGSIPADSWIHPRAEVASKGGRNPLNPSSLNPSSLNPEEDGPTGHSSASRTKPTVPCPYTAIVERYHDALPTLPKVKLMPEKRQKAMRKVWGWVLSTSKPDGSRRAASADEALQWFADYFARASANEWLMGRTSRSAEHAGWTCDIDFLLTDRGMKAVIEQTEAAA